MIVKNLRIHNNSLSLSIKPKSKSVLRGYKEKNTTITNKNVELKKIIFAQQIKKKFSTNPSIVALFCFNFISRTILHHYLKPHLLKKKII